MRLSMGLSNFGRCAAAVSLAGLLSAAALTPASAAGPFAGFTGQWAGSGDIDMTDGSHEKIRCKATYSVGPSGDALHIDMNCASDSYRVNIISNVVAQGNNFSGTWKETTRQVDGSVTGRVPAPGEFQASLEGTGFGIQLSATTNGKQQAVTIQSQGTDVQTVKISLRKA